MKLIVHYYKHRGFPKGFLAALKKFKCKVCAVCKSASVYKHTKRMKEKMVHNKRRKTSTGGPKKPTMEKEVLESEISEIESEDDLLQAFASEELHLDFAHSILLGYFNERYYLLFVVGRKNFMWATPTTTRMEPEDLVRDFITVSGLKIGLIHTDNEFTASTAFKVIIVAYSFELAP
eukprot:1258992-Rhodomonas_salina.2